MYYQLMSINQFINYNQLEITNKYLDWISKKIFCLIITPNGLELMCMIVQQFHVPQDYLNYYINYCLQFCQNIKEKGQQVRTIKYLTIFLKHLINKKMYKTSDLVTELQAFSIEFSNIGETSSLFKLIKNDISL